MCSLRSDDHIAHSLLKMRILQGQGSGGYDEKNKQKSEEKINGESSLITLNRDAIPL